MRKFPGSKPAETFDTLFDGRLEIGQKKEGYRFSIDALLLAHFAEPRPKDRIIDLGTGCGVIPLILIFRRKIEAVIGVEVQPSLADFSPPKRFPKSLFVADRDPGEGFPGPAGRRGRF